jgi:hypothetical protein
MMLRDIIFGQEEHDERMTYYDVKSIVIDYETQTARIQSDTLWNLTGISGVVKSGALAKVCFKFFTLDDRGCTLEFPAGRLATVRRKGEKLIIELTYKG